MIIPHRTRLFRITWITHSNLVSKTFSYLVLLMVCFSLKVFADTVNGDTVNGDNVTGLWNPATKEYRIIPKSDIGFEWGDYNVPQHHAFPTTYGFGYDRLSNEYKLVKILSPYDWDYRIMVSRVEVYTMNTNSWKIIEYIPYKITDALLVKGVFVHDALHWLARPCPERSNNEFLEVLLAFNMAGEVFYELPLLEIFNDTETLKHNCISVLEGFLCMMRSHPRVGFEVWVMKDYGVADSWTKCYSISLVKFSYVIPSFRNLRRIHSLKNGVILLEIQLRDPKFAALVFYDPKHERAWVGEVDLRCSGRRPNKVSTRRLPSKLLYTVSYVESLVSPQSGT